jgi:FtsH-binding integral membrane protein
VEQPTRTQQIWLWVTAAIVGLTLGEIVHAGYLADVGLVAAAGIVLGVGFTATQRAKRR